MELVQPDRGPVFTVWVKDESFDTKVDSSQWCVLLFFSWAFGVIFILQWLICVDHNLHNQKKPYSYYYPFKSY